MQLRGASVSLTLKPHVHVMFECTHIQASGASLSSRRNTCAMYSRLAYLGALQWLQQVYGQAVPEDLDPGNPLFTLTMNGGSGTAIGQRTADGDPECIAARIGTARKQERTCMARRVTTPGR